MDAPGGDTNGEAGDAYPDAEESLLRLHAAGWSVACTRFPKPDGALWVVSGYNGENQVLTAATSRDRAWWEACLQARSVAMLGRSPVPEAVE